jgi:hypothetical protein
VYALLTKKTASLAATAMMSAQETVSGQRVSSLALIRSMASKPRMLWLGSASLSAFFFLDLSMIDPSQPFGINRACVSFR